MIVENIEFVKFCCRSLNPVFLYNDGSCALCGVSLLVVLYVNSFCLAAVTGQVWYLSRIMHYAGNNE